MVDDETRGTRADPAASTVDGGKVSGHAPTQLHSETVGETIVPSWGASSIVSLPDAGYQLGELIGRGGMGEVLVAQDQRHMKVYRRAGSEWRVDSYGDGDHFELPTLSSPVAVAEIYDRILDADGRSLLR